MHSRREPLSNWKQIVYQSYVSSGHIRSRGATAEEHLRERRAYCETIIRRHFPRDRSSRILDVGCGHGALLYFLGQEGYSNLQGVDGSGEQVELARQLGIAGVELADAQDYLRSRGSESADVVALFDVLEHLTRQEAFDLLTKCGASLRRAECASVTCRTRRASSVRESAMAI